MRELEGFRAASDRAADVGSPGAGWEAGWGSGGGEGQEEETGWKSALTAYGNGGDTEAAQGDARHRGRSGRPPSPRPTAMLR